MLRRKCESIKLDDFIEGFGGKNSVEHVESVTVQLFKKGFMKKCQWPFKEVKRKAILRFVQIAWLFTVVITLR